jgi:hypothetical protein
MFNLFRSDPDRTGLLRALERRVEALEGALVAHNLERNHLITLLTSSENRLRAMLARAERLPKEPTANNGALDRALLARKGL